MVDTSNQSVPEIASRYGVYIKIDLKVSSGIWWYAHFERASSSITISATLLCNEFAEKSGCACPIEMADHWCPIEFSIYQTSVRTLMADNFIKDNLIVYYCKHILDNDGQWLILIDIADNYDPQTLSQGLNIQNSILKWVEPSSTTLMLRHYSWATFIANSLWAKKKTSVVRLSNGFDRNNLYNLYTMLIIINNLHTMLIYASGNHGLENFGVLILQQRFSIGIIPNGASGRTRERRNETCWFEDWEHINSTNQHK